jgi:hypothetical protein
MAEARAGFGDLSPHAVETPADEALTAVREASKAPSPNSR